MRLINAKTMRVEEFQDRGVPGYAILSHTWEENSEVTLEDMQSNAQPKKAQGYAKIQFACRQARKDLLSYVWVDTCCIDKTSSAELSEAINSMFRFYQEASTCYVYLQDVPNECPEITDEGSKTSSIWHDRFKESRWFTRGWTLQELIAPRFLKFYARDWKFIGLKSTLINTIAATTGIAISILTHRAPLASISCAQRISWACQRNTSRVEDQAYSLLGIFNLSMPMLYGEGSKAFLRLQEEIIKTHSDHSIFAWEPDKGCIPDGTLIAASPSNFASSRQIVRGAKPQAFDMTNRGLRISLLTIDNVLGYKETLAVLNCRYANDLSRTLALRLRKYSEEQEYHAIIGGEMDPHLSGFEPHLEGHRESRLVFVRAEDIASAKERSTLHITREFEPDLPKLMFWMSLSKGLFRIVEVFPEDQWDLHDGVMYARGEAPVRGGAVLETSSGSQVAIAFGYDVAAEKFSADENSGDGESRDHLLPCVWASPWEDAYSLRTVLERSYVRCDHTEPACISDDCVFAPVSARANVEGVSCSERFEIGIASERIMGDLVFVLSAKVTLINHIQAEDTQGGATAVMSLRQRSGSSQRD